MIDVKLRPSEKKGERGNRNEERKMKREGQGMERQGEKKILYMKRLDLDDAAPSVAPLIEV